MRCDALDAHKKSDVRIPNARPSEYSPWLLVRRRCRRRTSSRGIGCSFRVFAAIKYRRILVRRSRFAVGPDPGCAVFLDHGSSVAVYVLTNPLVELGLPGSLAQPRLAHRPRPVCSSHGLSLPTALAGFKGPRLAVRPCPLCSALRVWLPSRRLAPFEPGPALFHAGGAPGIHPSKRCSLRKVSAPFPAGCTHVPFLPALFPTPERRAGPQGRGFWVLTLSQVPDRPRAMNTRRTGGSPGFRPSRVRQRRPWPGFRPASSPTPWVRDDRTNHRVAGVPECQSTVARPSPRRCEAASDRAALLGFRTGDIPNHSKARSSGLWVHLTPRRALLPADRRSVDERNLLPKLSGTR
jgi:hypothetical protein